jgi:hypothetical protein
MNKKYLTEHLKHFEIKTDLPFYYYVISSNTAANYTIPKSSVVQSELTLELIKTIDEKRSKMKILAAEEKFEEAIVLKNELVTMQEELENSLKADAILNEANKSAKEMLIDLMDKLNVATKEEDYEFAVQLREKIKSINS